MRKDFLEVSQQSNYEELSPTWSFINTYDHNRDSKTPFPFTNGMLVSKKKKVESSKKNLKKITPTFTLIQNPLHVISDVCINMFVWLLLSTKKKRDAQKKRYGNILNCF